MKRLPNEWRWTGYYKKWELYLFRLFKLADYIESILRIHRLNAPPPEEFLNPQGFEDGLVRIPCNPFLMGDDDSTFFAYYDDLIEMGFKDTFKDYQRLLKELWKRMGEIKEFLGIVKGTRYIGEEREEWRLVNELDWYIEYSDYAPMMYRVILGDPKKELETLKKFKNFLRDRNEIKGIKSLKYY